MAIYSVRIGEQTYTADSRQPLIDAIPSGELIKGCLKGVCRVCRCRLVSGRVLEDGAEVALQGEFLPCISRVETDIDIVPAISTFHAARLKSKTWLSDQVMEVVLEVKRVFYNAKSVVTLKHPELSAVRSYSVVTLGKKAYDSITFHVKLRPGGLFSSLFATLSVGERLEYSMVSPSLPHYETPMTRLNIISGGSGMGAALSRGQELVAKYNIGEVAVYAVNRANLSDYHVGCIERFRSFSECKVDVINIPFHDWTHAGFDIGEHLAADVLAIGVGSDLVIGKLKNLPLCELESFG
ncbi:Mangotoxin biosynthesis protein MboB [Pseudomonas cichorii]|uniref:Mangotoxin biosynthesis protein MboB n=1 Tax=Pseudomonas cichorii TaxID=36746 RepID=A0A3M4LZR8_PSECI|nr:2Fe-2S iron-sulfur cluster-binding protein [Pseudomonas cichorii]RMQ46947.1 Mangotoxin biosynthesis protein MboB [Pseudomonas cichorii]